MIVGASGAGKGTVTKYLLQTFPNLFKLSVSWTTRAPRNGELDGREYFFVTKDTFEEEIKKDAFIEYCPVFSNIYGTHKSQIGDIMKSNKVIYNRQLFININIILNYFIINPYEYIRSAFWILIYKEL